MDEAVAWKEKAEMFQKAEAEVCVRSLNCLLDGQDKRGGGG